MKRNIQARLLAVLLPAILLITIGFTSVAADATPAAISQSYPTNTTGITEGTLVSFVSLKSNLIIPASVSTTSTLVGIAVGKPLVELSTSSTSSIQVVINGKTDALVSDANGAVDIGDKITVSPIQGIGMKATADGEIVGTAQASLNSVSTVTKSLKGTDGKDVPVKIGLLPVTVSVMHYAYPSSSGTVSSFVPPFLQKAANAISGKAVSPLRVLLSALALTLGFLIVTTMLYTAIRSTIISIGRNPLAYSTFRRSLIDIILSAVGVLIVSVVIVYGILFS